MQRLILILAIALLVQCSAAYKEPGTGTAGSTSGQVLTSNGSGVAPTYQTPSVTSGGDGGGLTALAAAIVTKMAAPAGSEIVISYENFDYGDADNLSPAWVLGGSGTVTASASGGTKCTQSVANNNCGAISRNVGTFYKASQSRYGYGCIVKRSTAWTPGAAGAFYLDIIPSGSSTDFDRIAFSDNGVTFSTTQASATSTQADTLLTSTDTSLHACAIVRNGTTVFGGCDTEITTPSWVTVSTKIPAVARGFRFIGNSGATGSGSEVDELYGCVQVRVQE